MTAASAAVIASCTVFNPLDRYQAGLGDKATGNDGGGVGTPDGGTPTPADGGRCNPQSRFGAPHEIEELNDPIADDLPSDVSLDELTLYFTSNRAGGGKGGVRIYSATRTTPDAKWNKPEQIFPNDGTWDDWSVSVSPNGLVAVLGSGRPGGTFDAGIDLFVATRDSTFVDFGTPKPAAVVNSSNSDEAPHWMADGKTLYFDSARSGQRAIYRSAVVGGQTFGAPEAVVELNTSSFNGAVSLSPDELTIYFASNRPPTTDEADIYVATRQRKSDQFGNVKRVDELSSDGVDAPARITPDGCRLYLGSTRNGGHFHIYVAERAP
jgi:hypothetical protein